MAGFILCWFFFPTWWIPPLRIRSGRNDNAGTFLRIRPLFPQYFMLYRGPHQARPGEPASPEGSSCTVLLGGAIQPHGLYSIRGGRQIAAPTDTLVGGFIQPHGGIFAMPPERHTGRSLRFRWRVVPFNPRVLFETSPCSVIQALSANGVEESTQVAERTYAR